MMTQLFFIDAKMIHHYKLLSTSTSSGLLKPIKLLSNHVFDWLSTVSDSAGYVIDSHVITEAVVYF